MRDRSLAARPLAPAAAAGLKRGSRRRKVAAGGSPPIHAGTGLREGGGDTDFIVGGGEKKGWREREIPLPPQIPSQETNLADPHPQTESRELSYPFVLKHN